MTEFESPTEAMVTPRVSVIVPFYRDPRLPKCIDALKSQSLSTDEYEVILVDNDPERATVIHDLPQNFRLVREAKPGSYAARNAAIRIANAEIMAFTDSDCIPDPEWLARGLAGMTDTSAKRLSGSVGIFREDGGTWAAWKYESHTAFRQKLAAKNGRSVTANLFVHRDLFETYGTFDDQLLSGGDFEWNGRLQDQGVSLAYREEVRVMHPARASMGEIARKYRRVVGGHAMVARRNKTSGIFLFRTMMPPVGLVKQLRRDGLSVRDLVFCGVVAWGLKMVAACEAVTVIVFDTKPTRQ